MADQTLKQAAAVNPGDKFELVFKNLLETLFVERMDQNEEIFVRFMNDSPFRKAVTGWLASEAYKRLRNESGIARVPFPELGEKSEAGSVSDPDALAPTRLIR